MENKKLTSVRLDPQTIEKVDAFVRKHYYWKRGTVISCVLDAVFDCFDEKSIYDMVRYWRGSNKNASGSFSLEGKTTHDDS